MLRLLNNMGLRRVVAVVLVFMMTFNTVPFGGLAFGDEGETPQVTETQTPTPTQTPTQTPTPTPDPAPVQEPTNTEPAPTPGGNTTPEPDVSTPQETPTSGPSEGTGSGEGQQPEVKQYTVKFVNYDDSLVKEEKIQENATYSKLNDLTKTLPARENYTFEKWINTANNAEFTAATPIVGNMTIKAVYKEVPVVEEEEEGEGEDDPDPTKNPDDVVTGDDKQGTTPPGNQDDPGNKEDITKEDGDKKDDDTYTPAEGSIEGGNELLQGVFRNLQGSLDQVVVSDDRSMFDSGLGISLMAAGDNNRSVEVGESINIQGSGTWSHKWEASPPGYVSLSNTDKADVTVDGIKATVQAVTLTHTYRNSGSWNTQTETFYVTVTAPAVDATSVTISGASELYQGRTTTLTAVVEPAGADPTVTWSSSDNKVATVDESGVVTGEGEGTATITATTANGITGEYSVTVKPAIRITLSPDSLVMILGKTDTSKLEATVTNDTGSKGVTWSSDNTGVATVDRDGNVKAIAAGAATITCASVADPSTTAICSVVVKEDYYKVIYNTNYPEGAKKFVYTNGSGASTIADAINSNAVYTYNHSNASFKAAQGFELANAEFKSWNTEADGSGTSYRPDEAINVDTDTSSITLYAIWGKVEEIKHGEITVNYYKTVNGSESVKKTAPAIFKGSGRERTATFLTANNQDTIIIKNFYAWKINNKEYEQNTYATVTVGNATTISAYPIAGTEHKYTAQFYVTKDSSHEGSGSAAHFYSVGSGKLKNTYDKSGRYQPDNGSVSEYIEEAPDAVTIANLLNVSVNDAQKVRWYLIADQSDGYHVDGVLSTLDTYWTITYWDKNEKVKAVTVEDGTLVNFYKQAPYNSKGEGFEGWLLDNKLINGNSESNVFNNINIYAKYKEQYNVTFYNEDETVYQNHSVYKGDSLTVPAGPNKDEDDDYSYTFDRWEPMEESYTLDNLENVTQDMAFKAIYTEEAKSYTVTYNNGKYGTLDGQNAEGNVVHGDLIYGANTPAAPKVTANAGYYFAGWEPERDDTVTGDAEYTAQYKPVKEVTVTGESKELKYNGYYQSVTGYETEGLPEGYALSGLTYNARGQNVQEGGYEGSFTETPKIKITDKNGKDVTDEFTINLKPGTLTITPRQLIFNSPSEEFVYDGKTHKVSLKPALDYLDEKSDLFVAEEGIKLTPTGEITYPGQSPVDTGFDWAFTKGNPNNYIVTINHGKLTMAPCPITVTANSETFTYDGSPKSNGGYEVTEGSLADTDKLTAMVAGSITNVNDNKEGNNEISDIVIKHKKGDKDVTGCYDITAVNGTLKIDPLAVKVTVKDAEKAFGADDPEFEYEVSPAPLPDDINVTVSRIDAGNETVDTHTDVLVPTTTLDGNKNYAITKVPGDFTINAADLSGSVTAEGVDTVYDGKAYSITVEAPEGATIKYGEQEGAYSSENPAYTNVGEHTVYYEVTKEGYIPYTNSAIVKIKQRPLKVTAKTLEKNYDGTPLVGVYTHDNNLVEGESIEYAGKLASITNVGEQDYTVPTVTIKSGSKDVTKNYSITKIGGTLTIKKAELTITAPSAEKEYDGTPLTNNNINEATVSGLVTGHKLTALNIEGSRTDVGEADNIASNATIVAEGLAGDVTNNYTIKYDSGTLEVTKNTTEITVTANSDERTYDGTALTNSGFSDNKVLPVGHTITAVVEGSQTVVGEADNVVTSYNIIRNSDNKDVTEFYSKAKLVDGKLTVKKRPVTINVNNATKTFNIADPVFTGTVDGALEDEPLADVVYSRTNNNEEVGVYEGVITAAYTGNPNYDVTVNNGNFEIIESGDLTVSADNVVQTYDGTAYGVTATSLEGAVIKYKDEEEGTYTLSESPKYTDVGVYTVEFEATLKGYKTATGSATVTITPAKITLTANSNENLYYNGEEQTVTGYTGTPDGLTISVVTASGSGTYVGEYAVTFSDKDKIKISAGSKDVTDNYEVTYNPGTMKINKNATEITVTANSKSKAYDGTALVDAGYKVTGTLGTGDSVVAKVEGSATYVSDTEDGNNEVTDVKIYKDTEDVTEQYSNITSENGTLTISKRALTITANSAGKEYDGTPLTSNSYVTDGNLATGDSLTSVTVTGSQTNVGESKNVASEAVIGKALAQDVTGNYEITYVNGTLKVTANKTLEISVTANDSSKDYDGTPLTDEGFVVKVVKGNLPSGETVTATVTGSQTDAGSSDNTISAVKVMRGNEDVTKYYTNITSENGTLTVTPRSVTVTAKSGEFTYNGQAQTLNEYTVDGLVGDDAISAEVEGSITYPSEGTVVNEVKSHEFTKGSAANYAVSYENGELTMVFGTGANKKDLTVAAASGSKVYDGTALTNGNIEYDEEVLLPGDSVIATVTGSPTNVADTVIGNNVITDIKVMNGDVDVTAAYNITPVNGTLTVTPRSVTVKAKSGEFTYNGQAQTLNEYTVDGLVGDDAISAEVEGSITYPSEGTVVNEVKSHEFTKGSAANYAVSYENGELTMVFGTGANKKDLTVAAASGSKVYDGTALTNGNIEYDEEVLLPGDSVIATVTGSPTNVADTVIGNNVISDIKVMNGDVDVTAAYNITPVNGTLTVDPLEVTVTVNNAAKVYDTEDPEFGYNVTPDNLPDAIDVVVNRTNADNNSVGEHEDVLVATTSLDENDNYNITMVPGDFIITTSSELAVTANDVTVTYDGNGHGITVNTNREEAVIKYKDENGDYTLDECPEYVNAGTYTVEFQATLGGYEPTTGSATVTINRKDITITVNNATKVTGASDPAFSGTVNGLVDGETLDVTYTRNNSNEAPGVYDDVIVAQYQANSNYAVTVVPGDLTITAAPVAPVDPDPTDPTPADPTPADPTGPVLPTPPTPTTGPTPAPATTTTGGTTTLVVIPSGTTGLPTPVDTTDDGIVVEPADDEGTTISDPETPLAPVGQWALLNLILTICCVIAMLLLLVWYFVNKRNKDEEEEGEYQTANMEDDEEEKELKRKGIWRLLSLIPGIGSVIVFILTEDMSLPMVFVDRWTLLMVFIALVQLIVVLMSKKKFKDTEEDEEETMAA